MENIKEKQLLDAKLQDAALKYPNCYSHKNIDTVRDVLCHIKPGNQPSQWTIALPKGMIQSTNKWSLW